MGRALYASHAYLQWVTYLRGALKLVDEQGRSRLAQRRRQQQSVERRHVRGRHHSRLPDPQAQDLES